MMFEVDATDINGEVIQHRNLENRPYVIDGALRISPNRTTNVYYPLGSLKWICIREVKNVGA